MTDPSGRNGRKGLAGCHTHWAALLVFLLLVSTSPAQTYHTVARGERLADISKKYGVSQRSLILLNDLQDPDRILVGQRLKVPPDPPKAETSPTQVTGDRLPRLVTLKAGESLSDLNRRYDVPVSAIIQANDIQSPDQVQAGTELIIPGSPRPFQLVSIRPGQSLSEVATSFRTPLDLLVQVNALDRPDLVLPGQQIIVPGFEPDGRVVLSNDAPEPAAKASPQGFLTVQVQPGENLTALAARHGLTLNELARANGIADPDLILSGQSLTIPLGDDSASPSPPTPPPPVEKVVTVQKNQTLSDIAVAHGVTVSSILANNGLTNPDRIYAGQKLRIGGSGSSSSSTPARSITVSVRPNETLEDIARRHKVSISRLASYNHLRNPDRIYVGQKLKIPPEGASIAPAPTFALPSSIQKKLDKIRLRRSWRHIVIHHSGDNRGSVKGMDSWHRRQGMENGLAYHFVIGNGRDEKDGDIIVGNRWTRQLQGGHVRSLALNEVSIGICLIGNFQTTAPTARQMQSLNALIDWLLDKTRLKPGAVTTHTEIHPNHTLCPGRKFPTSSFLKALDRRH